MDNTAQNTQNEPNSIQPIENLPQKSKLPIVLLVMMLLFVFTGVGMVLGKYLLAPQATPVVEKLILPTPTITQSVITPTITDPTQVNWKTYTNTGMGIQFKYPLDPKWNIKENTQGTNSLTLYNYDVDKAPGRSYAPSIDGDIFKIEISKQKSNLTPNEWLNQQKSVISPITNKPEEFFNVKTITVDSQNGIYYETKDALGGSKVGGAIFKSPDNDLVFFFGGLNFQGNKQVFDQILSTFKFLNNQNNINIPGTENSLSGIVKKTISRPAPDIPYDYEIILDKPLTGITSGLGENQIMQTIIIQGKGLNFETYVNKHINFLATLEWGLAESRVLQITKIIDSN
jgi:hypothetical protein